MNLKKLAILILLLIYGCANQEEVSDNAAPEDNSTSQAMEDLEKSIKSEDEQVAKEDNEEQHPDAISKLNPEPIKDVETETANSSNGLDSVQKPSSVALVKGKPKANPSDTTLKQVFQNYESLPVIPAKATQKNGVLLNRFYVLRSGDTPEKVSSLIYGSPQKAGEIKNWNNVSWKPGNLVYFESPTDKHDTRIKSFYQERQIPVENYTLKAKENLKSLARKRYGDSKSWKEIAIINGIDLPESYQEGSQVSLYPKNLTSLRNPPKNLQNSGGSSGQMAAQAAPNEMQPQTGQAPEGDSLGSVSEPIPEDTTQAGSTNSIIRVIQQNLFTIGIGAMIIACLSALIYLRKKRKGEEVIASTDNVEATRTEMKRRKKG